MELVPDRVATMLGSIGQAPFGEAVLQLFDPDLDITHCVAFERRSSHLPPKITYAAGLSPEATRLSHALARDWMEHDYSCDPWLAALERMPHDIARVQFIDVPASPEATGKSAHIVEHYYDRLNIGEEVTYTIRTRAGVDSLSLCRRRGSKPLSQRQQIHLQSLCRLMLESTHRHAELVRAWPLGADKDGDAPDQHGWTHSRAEKFVRLRAALLTDSAHLTVREAEICAYIVLGHTAIGISLMLNISTNTVATHRKRAYAKLEISSQTELFSVCLQHCL